MNTQQLEYLRESVKTGSFSRAADTLGLNQSVLSRQVAALEQEMGCQLLKRHGRGVVPTEVGERLLELSETFLHAIAQLQAIGKGADRQLSGTFRLGVPMFFSQSIAPRLMASVRRQYPAMTLVVREGHSGDLHDWLLAGELSAAVIYEQKRPRQLAGDALFLEPVYVVGSRDLAKRYDISLDEGMTMQQLSLLPLLIPTRRHGTRLDLDLAMKQQHLVPNIVHQVDALGARMLLVREGVGVTIFESAGLLIERRDPALFVVPIVAPAFFHELVWVDARNQEGGAAWRTFVHELKQEIVHQRLGLGDAAP